jgi:hypothetical protein
MTINEPYKPFVNQDIKQSSTSNELCERTVNSEMFFDKITSKDGNTYLLAKYGFYMTIDDSGEFVAVPIKTEEKLKELIKEDSERTRLIVGGGNNHYRRGRNVNKPSAQIVYKKTRKIHRNKRTLKRSNQIKYNKRVTKNPYKKKRFCKKTRN